MYFVINKTQKQVVLQDINITLGPRQGIDLEKVLRKEKYENSRHLRLAQGNGDIEIRISTKESKKQKKIITPKKDTTKDDIEKMKNEIIKEMKNELKNINKEPVNNDSLSKKDLVEIMTEVMKNMPRETIIREGSKEEFDDEKVEIDDKLLSEINKRAVNKMVENVKSEEIKYKKEKQQNDLDQNIEELEGLLG